MREYTTFEKIILTSEEVLKCQFSKWARKFENDMYPYEIVPMPKEFIQYISSDGIRLPTTEKITIVQHDSDNEYSDWEEEGESEIVDISQFQSFHDRVKKTISKLNHVVPKLNWSSPKDAKWIMAGNTMKCDNVNDVYLLLNSSDHIADDLDYPFSAVNEQVENVHVEYELVLKKWVDINPALEFRIFIRNNTIIGISQRDLQHYSFLNDIKQQLQDSITQFVNSKVIPKMELNKFILDVYIPRPFNKVYIIDINPFSRKSDDLLFTWNELLTMETCEFRLVDENNIGSFARKEYGESQVPIDVVGASMDTEAMVELAREWNKVG